MTNTWHRYVAYRLQADDFIEYFNGLLASREFAKAKWELDWNPYVRGVLATYGRAKLDELRKNLKNAIDNSAALC